MTFWFIVLTIYTPQFQGGDKISTSIERTLQNRYSTQEICEDHKADWNSIHGPPGSWHEVSCIEWRVK
jgi:hypothetical protein